MAMGFLHPKLVTLNTAVLLALAAPAAADPPPAPYSLPWQLRSVMPATVLRVDSTMAFFDDPKTGAGTSEATMVLFTYKVNRHIVPLLRWGVDVNAPAYSNPTPSLSNGLVGVTYS